MKIWKVFSFSLNPDFIATGVETKSLDARPTARHLDDLRSSVGEKGPDRVGIVCDEVHLDDAKVDALVEHPYK